MHRVLVFHMYWPACDTFLVKSCCKPVICIKHNKENESYLKAYLRCQSLLEHFAVKRKKKKKKKTQISLLREKKNNGKVLYKQDEYATKSKS